jgi:chitinase
MELNQKKIVIGAAYFTRGWEKVSNNGPDASNPGCLEQLQLL